MLQHVTSRWKTLLLGLGLCLPLWAQAQEAQLPISPIEARELAAENLTRVLEWLPPDHLEQFGFTDKDDFSAISIGMPLYQNVFSDESVIAGTDARMQTHIVQLPLILNGAVRCFIYLSPGEEGRWVASGLGGNNEARTWNHFFTSKEASGKDHLSLLHIPQTGADYLWQEKANTWLNISVSKHQSPGKILHTGEVFEEAVRIAAEARATVKDDAGS